MRALVTGAGGFIGSHVCQALGHAGIEVRGLSTCAPDPGLEIEHVTGDVRDADALRRAVDGCDAIVHLAAVYSYARADAKLMRAVNVEGTRAVLDAAGGRRVVLTSSAATCGPVAGRPATEDDAPPAWELSVPYKASKIAAERLALDAAAGGADVVVVNPTTPVGAGDARPTPTGQMVSDVVSGRIRAYLRGAAMNVVGVRDVARGHLLALEHGRAGERYLLGGEDLELREIFAILARHAGRPAPRVGIPYLPILAAARLADAAGRLIGHEPSLLRLDEVRLARLPMSFASAKARRELGYTPRRAEEALAAAAAWFMARAARPR